MFNNYFQLFLDGVAIDYLWYAYNIISNICVYESAGHFHEISAVYTEEIGESFIVLIHYISNRPAVFKSKRLTKNCNSFHLANVVYYKPSGINRSDESDERYSDSGFSEDPNSIFPTVAEKDV
jgi:hypothetical protein